MSITSSARLCIDWKLSGQGTLRWDNADGILHFYKCLRPSVPTPTSRLLPLWKHFPRLKASSGTSFSSRRQNTLLMWLMERHSRSADLTDGVRALQMALAAYESQKTEKSVRLSG